MTEPSTTTTTTENGDAADGDPRDADASQETEATRKPQGSTRALVALLAFVLGFATVPHRVMERDASKWFDGNAAKTDALARGVARWTASSDLSQASFSTGTSRFDGEWLFATYMMAAMGFGQVALNRDDVRDENVARMEKCLDAMLDARVRTFEDTAWGNDAIATLHAEPGSALDRGHVAYLGYMGLALALHRVLRPTSRFVATEEAVMTALARRIEASSIGFVETYPGEVYPVDNTAAFAALALHARATRQLPAKAMTRGLDAVRNAIDPSTGLLFQAVTSNDGKPRDAPRASGTALASYFLSYADEATSNALFRALERSQFRTVLGFGGMMEYPRGGRGVSGGGHGDIDSGPVFLGFGVSASGFAIGASRAHGDRETFTALFATAQLFGAPLDEDETLTYATGGPIGDAILFAMLTAPRAPKVGSWGT